MFEYYCYIEKSFDEAWPEKGILKWNTPKKQTPKGRKESIQLMSRGKIKTVANTLGMGRIELDENKDLPTQRVTLLKARREELGISPPPPQVEGNQGGK
jgi:hypothetical protein